MNYYKNQQVWVIGNEKDKKALEAIPSQWGIVQEAFETPLGLAYKVKLEDGRIDLVSENLVKKRSENPRGLVSQVWDKKERKFDKVEEKDVYFDEREPSWTQRMNELVEKAHGSLEKHWVEWQGFGKNFIYHGVEDNWDLGLRGSTALTTVGDILKAELKAKLKEKQDNKPKPPSKPNKPEPKAKMEEKPKKTEAPKPVEPVKQEKTSFSIQEWIRQNIDKKATFTTKGEHYGFEIEGSSEGISISANRTRYKPWVAVIKGKDEKYTLKRDFLDAQEDGNTFSWNIDVPCILTFGRGRNYSFLLSDGEGFFSIFGSLTKEEQEKLLILLDSMGKKSVSTAPKKEKQPEKAKGKAPEDKDEKYLLKSHPYFNLYADDKEIWMTARSLSSSEPKRKSVKLARYSDDWEKEKKKWSRKRFNDVNVERIEKQLEFYRENKEKIDRFLNIKTADFEFANAQAMLRKEIEKPVVSGHNKSLYEDTLYSNDILVDDISMGNITHSLETMERIGEKIQKKKVDGLKLKSVDLEWFSEEIVYSAKDVTFIANPKGIVKQGGKHKEFSASQFNPRAQDETDVWLGVLDSHYDYNRHTASYKNFFHRPFYKEDREKTLLIWLQYDEKNIFFLKSKDGIAKLPQDKENIDALMNELIGEEEDSIISDARALLQITKGNKKIYDFFKLVRKIAEIPQTLDSSLSYLSSHVGYRFAPEEIGLFTGQFIERYKEREFYPLFMLQYKDDWKKFQQFFLKELGQFSLGDKNRKLWDIGLDYALAIENQRFPIFDYPHKNNKKVFDKIKLDYLALFKDFPVFTAIDTPTAIISLSMEHLKKVESFQPLFDNKEIQAVLMDGGITEDAFFFNFLEHFEPFPLPVLFNRFQTRRSDGLTDILGGEKLPRGLRAYTRRK